MSSGRTLIAFPDKCNCGGCQARRAPDNVTHCKSHLLELHSLPDRGRQRCELVIVGTQLAQVGHVAQSARQSAQRLELGARVSVIMPATVCRA